MHVLLAMSSDFNSPVSNDTIREYVAPFVLKSDGSYEDALTRLKLSGVSTGAATSGLVTALLEQKNITKAAELCRCFLFVRYEVDILKISNHLNYIRMK